MWRLAFQRPARYLGLRYCSDDGFASQPVPHDSLPVLEPSNGLSIVPNEVIANAPPVFRRPSTEKRMESEIVRTTHTDHEADGADASPTAEENLGEEREREREMVGLGPDIPDFKR